jgi:hypothetical protein
LTRTLIIFKDLFIAIAQAIGTFSKANLEVPKGSYKGVYIVQTTKWGTDRDDWEDQTSIERIKNRLRRIMKGLPTLAGGIEADEIEPALQKYLHFKRVSTTMTELCSLIPRLYVLTKSSCT